MPRRRRIRPWICTVIATALGMSASCYADFDVNAVAGVVTLGGEPAPSSTLVLITCAQTGCVFETRVDGPNVPPFLKNRGRFDSGDMPEFATGDVVEVWAEGHQNEALSAVLMGGTVRLNLQIANPENLDEEDDRDGGNPMPDPGQHYAGIRFRETLDFGQSSDESDERVETFMNLIGSVGDRVLGEMDRSLSTLSRGIRSVHSVLIEEARVLLGGLALLTDPVLEAPLVRGGLFTFLFLGLLFFVVLNARSRRSRLASSYRSAEDAEVDQEPFWDKSA